MNLVTLLFTSSLLASTTAAAQGFREIDGSGNNPGQSSMGQANTPLNRTASVDYGDGLSTPAGAGRPGARAISNALSAQTGSAPNRLGASDYIWQWGQFVDHDVDLTGGASPSEPFDIPVPTGDPFFDPFNTGTAVIPLDRSAHTMDMGGVRQQMNQITAWIDASNVYGSNAARAAELRAMDGTGRLKTSSGDLLPFNVNAFPNAGGTAPTLFLAGDVRANEQVALTSMHTLFVREHNAWADMIGVRFPSMTGEQLYQTARMIIGAEMQAITYNEFLPVLLGPRALRPYRGYDQRVNAAISNEFSTAAYRFGHSMLNSTLHRLGSDLRPIAAGNLALRDAFFAPPEILSHGIDSLLRGLAHQAAQEVDPLIVDDVRNFLFGPPGSGGFDLAALNVQRGRDHGLASYNDLREAYGLSRATGFGDVTSNPARRDALRQTYGSVDDIDAWVGGLAEDLDRDALVGPLVRAVLVDQFERLRDGDRFWYQRVLPPNLLRIVARRTLKRILVDNTRIRSDELPRNVFLVPIRDADLGEDVTQHHAGQ